MIGPTGSSVWLLVGLPGIGVVLVAIYAWWEGLITRERFFNPLATPEIWLRQDDVRIFSCEAADTSCVVPSAP